MEALFPFRVQASHKFDSQRPKGGDRHIDQMHSASSFPPPHPRLSTDRCIIFKLSKRDANTCNNNYLVMRVMVVFSNVHYFAHMHVLRSGLDKTLSLSFQKFH